MFYNKSTNPIELQKRIDGGILQTSASQSGPSRTLESWASLNFNHGGVNNLALDIPAQEKAKQPQRLSRSLPSFALWFAFALRMYIYIYICNLSTATQIDQALTVFPDASDVV